LIVIGVDPGVHGALAMIDLASARILSAIDMPARNLDPATKTRRAVDPNAIGRWIEEQGRMPDLVVIEHQQPMGHEGMTTAFVLGVMFGAISTVFVGLGAPIAFANPSSWKRKAGLLKQDKAAVLPVAERIFGRSPDLQIVRGECTKEQAIARADAAVLGWYGLPAQLTADRASIPAPKVRPLPIRKPKTLAPVPLFETKAP